MAIITKARMQQLRGKYNQLNKEAMLPGEIAICDDHNPVVRTNTGYKEILTKDNAEYFEDKVAEIDNAISSANKATENVNKAINDMGTATTENTQKIDNAITQLEADKEQKFEELDTNVANTVSNAVSDLNTAKEQAISDMNTATDDNTKRVDDALQQITTKIGIDDTTSSTMTTYSSDKIDKLIEAVGGGAGLHKEIVQELPTSDIKDNTLYLVPSTTSEINNVYDEYIYIDGSWEIIGSTAVDLTNYYKKNEVDTLLGNKVTKEEGKGLFSGSYNDLSDTPTIPTLTNSLTATVAGTALDATQGKILNDKLGSTDISGVGDGSVTGALSTLNSKLSKLGRIRALTYFNSHNTQTITFSEYHTAALIFMSMSNTEAILYVYSNGYLVPIKASSLISVTLSSDFKTITVKNNSIQTGYLGIIQSGNAKINIL